MRVPDMLTRTLGVQSGPTTVGPVKHLLMGAASGFLTMVGLQYLALRLTQMGVDRACRTVPEQQPLPD